MEAFSGLRIVDLSRILSGPFCTMYFGDLGADVIKIEPPTGDDTRTWGPPFVEGESAYFLSVNRNKKSVVLDLKDDDDRQRLLGLVRQADVVVENFRPGTLAKLGIGFDVLASVKPDIILVSISGFGQTGPYRDDPGYDVIAQGMSGLMAITGELGGPPVKPGLSLADVSAGMWAIIGILTALYQRRQDQEPQPRWIDISLLEAMMAFHTYAAGNFFATGKDPVPLGNAHPNICPYQAFEAADGYMNLAVGNDSLWKRFCEAMGYPEWVTDTRFRTNADRVNNRAILIPLLAEHFISRPVAYWVNLLKESGIPCGPIYRFSDLYADPYIRERNMVFSVEHPTAGTVRQVAHPIKFGPDAIPHRHSAPPLLGQHTADVLERPERQKASDE